MHWLITTDKNVDRNLLAKRLRQAGCDLDENFGEPIPLDDEDLVFEVPGPADLAQKLANEPDIKGVHPDSELTLY